MAFLSIIDSQSVWTARQDGESLTIAAWGKHPDEKEIPLPPRWTMLEATRVTPIPDVTFFSYPRLRGSLDWQNMSQAILSIKARLFKSCLVAPLLDNEGVQVGCVGFVTSSPRTFDSGDCRMMANIAELAVREMELIKERTKDTTPGVALDLTVGEAADFGGFASRVNTSSTGAGVLLRPVNPSQVVASFDEDLGDQAHVTSPTTNAKNINKDFADSVILLVDTRTIDWTVLYASSSLAPLTGIAPDVAIGLAINTLFVGSSKAGGDGDGSGSTSIILEGLRAEAEAGKAFVMQQAHIRRDKVPSRPSLSEEKPKNIYNTFMLSFKPGALGPLDSQAALWDIPPGLPPPKSERLLGLYFARVYLVNERQDLGELAGGHTRSQSSILSSMAMTDERTHQTLQINPLLGISVLFEGLTPISVLGQGALGTVYKCTWHEAPVAVKVQDYLLKGQGDLWRAEVEVELGESLDHVNIVRTVAHAAHFLDRDDANSQPSWAMNFTSENFNEVFSQKANAYQIVVAEKIAASDAKFTGEIEVSSKSLTSPPAPGEGLRAKRRASLISSQATNAAPSEVSSNSIVTLGNGIVSLAQNADSSVRSFARESSYIDFKRDSDKACSSLSHLLEARVSTSLVDILLEHANQSHGSVKSNHLLSHRISPILEEIEVTRKSMEQPQAIGRANDSEGGLIELTPMASELLGKLILARNSEQSTKSATISRTSTYQRQGSQASSLDNAFVHVNHLLEQGESKKAPHSQTSVASLTLSRKGLHPPQVPSEHRSSNQTVASTNSHPTSGQHLSAAGTSNHGDATSEASASHVSTWHTILPADMAANSQLWYGPQSAGGGSLLGSLVNTNDRSSNAAAFTRGHSGLDQNTNANPTIDLRSMMSTMMGSNYSSNQPDSRSINNSSYNVTPQALNQLSPKGSQVLQEGVTWQSVDGTSESIPGPGSVPGPSQCSASTPNTPNTTGQPNSSPPSPMIQFPVHLRLYSVMEFLDKGSLQDAVDHGLFRTIRSGREELLLPWILETMAEVASALSYMHSKGAVHGDLSAVNVLLKSSAKHPPRGWFSKVCDFGQSVRLKPGQTSIKSTSYGTVNYCSPEVLSHRLVSRASDVWSLGVLMNQCVTGHKPWKGLSPEQIMLVVGVEQKQKLQWPDGLDDEVRELGQKLLSLEPAMRPSAAEAKETLLKLLERLKIRTLNDVHAGSPASVGPLSL